MALLFARLGPLLNESLSAAIAIISGSFLLYGVVKDVRNQVARAFSILLLFVTLTYIGDLGVGFAGERLESAETWLRFQWIGIAFTPAAYVHVSDAILAMTGLPSRGRRRWTVRLLYLAAAIFLTLVVASDAIVRSPSAEPAPHFRPGPAFALFLIYFVGSVTLSFWFILRARRRTLTESTRRRMTYLLATYAAPALAVFPFLLVSGRAELSAGLFYAVLMLADAALAIMLTFMAYVMAFMGTLQPDRLIKSQMLQFFLRGPVVAIATLAVIVWVPRAGRVVGLPGQEVMPFLAVFTILFLQWSITILRPPLERLLIYAHDHPEIRRIQEMQDRLLATADFTQLLDSILAALCDYLRVPAAFVASFSDGQPRLERTVGLQAGFTAELEQAADLASEVVNGDRPQPVSSGEAAAMFVWRGFWLIPLHTRSNGQPRLIGLLGVARPADPISPDQPERWRVLMALAARVTEVLEDRHLQNGIFAALEGLMPEIRAIQQLRGEAQYGGVEALTAPRGQPAVSPDFVGRVKDALNQYWGGPKLTDSALMRLAVVQQALNENEGNPQRAMRAVLHQAIENLRPEGQRSMTTTEWILYNILEMRFIQGRKVRDVAMRLAMSESDLYRKQRVAIESVAEVIAKMEQGASDPGEAAPPTR